MMIPCNYEVNVARIACYPGQIPRFEHFCRIELGNISEKEAKNRFEIIKKWDQLTGPEWKLTLNYVECSGHFLEEV